MPNWCSNILQVRGQPKEIQRFVKKACKRKDVLSFDKFVPYPDEFKRRDREAAAVGRLIEKKELPPIARINDSFNSGGYDWRVVNWGTKWDANKVGSNIDLSGGCADYFFDTAWAPPIPVVEKMSKDFPGLKFTLQYEESGMGFEGEIVYQGGEVISEREGEYKGDKDEEEGGE